MIDGRRPWVRGVPGAHGRSLSVTLRRQTAHPAQNARVAPEIASAPRLTGEPPPLIFDWRRPRGVKRRLAAWLIVVAAGHAALFYLFRVASPVVSLKPPPQQAVLYLPPLDSEVRTLLSAMDDRFPGALLRPEDYTLKADMEALAKATPPSVLSWASHRPALKPFPQPLVARELPPLIQPGEPLLPEATTEALSAPASEKAKPEPFVVTDENPGGRTATRQPAWPEKLTDEWPPSGNVPFKLGLARNGRPEFCLPLSPAATGVDLEVLRRALMGMQFNAVTGGPPWQWITVAVRW